MTPKGSAVRMRELCLKFEAEEQTSAGRTASSACQDISHETLLIALSAARHKPRRTSDTTYKTGY
jgi:hypothetical protein